MLLKQQLLLRSNSKCELCNSTNNLSAFTVPPKSDNTLENSILICRTCKNQIEQIAPMNLNHWRSLNDTMWSEVPAVQVMVWRMLNRIKGEGWPQDLLDMLYLDETTLQWAQATQNDNEQVIHLDSNGNTLTAGDTVTLIQDLKVKGANFTAKRGTAVRRISLVADNAEHIEGKVEGQRIVILTKYVKKAK